MRDYSFGNFLHELRTRKSLTQYQFGMPVDSSDSYALHTVMRCFFQNTTLRWIELTFMSLHIWLFECYNNLTMYTEALLSKPSDI